MPSLSFSPPFLACNAAQCYCPFPDVILYVWIGFHNFMHERLFHEEAPRQSLPRPARRWVPFRLGGQRPRARARGGGRDGADGRTPPPPTKLARANGQGCCWLLCVFSLPASSVLDPLRLRPLHAPPGVLACSCDFTGARRQAAALGKHCSRPGVACLYWRCSSWVAGDRSFRGGRRDVYVRALCSLHSPLAGRGCRVGGCSSRAGKSGRALW